MLRVGCMAVAPPPTPTVPLTNASKHPHLGGLPGCVLHREVVRRARSITPGPAKGKGREDDDEVSEMMMMRVIFAPDYLILCARCLSRAIAPSTPSASSLAHSARYSATGKLVLAWAWPSLAMLTRS